jgi:TPR repeat protein
MGLPDAKFALGDCYARGFGVLQDHGEALHWYREGADQGHAPSQYSLAWLYADKLGNLIGKGIGVPVVPLDDEEAVRLLR